jgi:hypothetical protein
MFQNGVNIKQLHFTFLTIQRLGAKKPALQLRNYLYYMSLSNVVHTLLVKMVTDTHTIFTQVLSSLSQYCRLTNDSLT